MDRGEADRGRASSKAAGRRCGREHLDQTPGGRVRRAVCTSKVILAREDLVDPDEPRIEELRHEEVRICGYNPRLLGHAGHPGARADRSTRRQIAGALDVRGPWLPGERILRHVGCL